MAVPTGYVNLGDQVFIFTEISDRPRGYLNAKGMIDKQCGLNVADGPSTPSDVRGSLFRIYPMQRYSAAKALTKARATTARRSQQLHSHVGMEFGRSTERGGGADLDGSAKIDITKLSSLAEAEKRQNRREYSRVVGSPLRYGQVVQLLHVKSGKFVTVRKKVAAWAEKQSMMASLDDGNEWSWFTVLPFYKLRSEGDYVQVGDQIVLRATKSVVTCLHASLLYLFDGRAEVNGSSQRTPWTIAPCVSYATESLSPVRSGDVVRLYHTETERYIVCDMTDSGESEAGLGYHDVHGKSAPPTNALFEIQALNEMGQLVGVGTWEHFYRLKHISTGKYLAVAPPTLPKESDNPMPNSRYSLASEGSLGPGDLVDVGMEIPSSDATQSALQGDSATQQEQMMDAEEQEPKRDAATTVTTSTDATTTVAGTGETPGDSNETPPATAGRTPAKLAAMKWGKVARASMQSTASVESQRRASDECPEGSDYCLPAEQPVIMVDKPDDASLFSLSATSVQGRPDRAIERSSCVRLTHVLTGQLVCAGGAVSTGSRDSERQRQWDTLRSITRVNAMTVSISSTIDTSVMEANADDDPQSVVPLVCRTSYSLSDAFMVFPTTGTDTRVVDYAIELRNQLNMFAEKARTATQPLSFTQRQEVNRMHSVVRDLILFLADRESADPFSEKFIPIKCHQTLVREQLVLAALFAVIEAPFVEFGGSLLTLKESSMADYADLRILMRLCYQAVIVACADSRRNEEYVSRWIPTMQAHMTMRFNAEACLTHLLDQNRRLLETMIHMDTVVRFVELLRVHKEAGYFRFLRALCSVNGKAISRTQEMVTNKLLFDPDAGSILLDISRKSKTSSITITYGDVSVCRRVTIDEYLRLAPPQIDFNALEYLEEQILLFHELCLDRNYLAINRLQESITRDVLLEFVRREDFPYPIRAAFARLSIVLYVDTDPFEARAPVQLVRLWSELRPELTIEDILKNTTRPAQEHLSDKPIEQNGIVQPSIPDVQAVLVAVIRDTVAEERADTSPLSKSRWQAQSLRMCFVASALQLVYALARFGAYTYSDLQGLVHVLLDVLKVEELQRNAKGRSTSAAGMARPSLSDFHGPDATHEHEEEGSYAMSVSDVVSAKMKALEVIMLLADWSVNDRVTLLLNAFKMLVPDCVLAHVDSKWPGDELTDDLTSRNVRSLALAAQRLQVPEESLDETDPLRIAFSTMRLRKFLDVIDRAVSEGVLDAPSVLELRESVSSAIASQTANVTARRPATHKNDSVCDRSGYIASVFNIVNKGVPLNIDGSYGRDIISVVTSLVQSDHRPLAMRALRIMFLHFNSRARLLGIGIKVQLIVAKEGVAAYHTARGLLDIVRQERDRAELWIGNESDAARQQCNRLVSTLEELRVFFDDGERAVRAKKQRLLRNLNAHADVVGVLLLRGRDKDPGLAKAIDCAHKFLQLFCADNPENQRLLWDCVDILAMQLEDVPAACQTIVAVVQNNSAICGSLRERLVRDHVRMLERENPDVAYLAFFNAVISASERPIKRNQLMVAHAFTASEIVTARVREGIASVIATSESHSHSHSHAHAHTSDSAHSSSHPRSSSRNGAQGKVIPWSELAFHFQFVDLLSRCCIGKISEVEILCQSLISLRELVSAVLRVDVPPEGRAAYLLYLTEAYVYCEIEVKGMAQNAAMWELFARLAGEIQAAATGHPPGVNQHRYLWAAIMCILRFFDTFPAPSSNDPHYQTVRALDVAVRAMSSCDWLAGNEKIAAQLCARKLKAAVLGAVLNRHSVLDTNALHGGSGTTPSPSANRNRATSVGTSGEAQAHVDTARTVPIPDYALYPSVSGLAPRSKSTFFVVDRMSLDYEDAVTHALEHSMVTLSTVMRPYIEAEFASLVELIESADRKGNPIDFKMCEMATTAIASAMGVGGDDAHGPADGDVSVISALSQSKRSHDGGRNAHRPDNFHHDDDHDHDLDHEHGKKRPKLFFTSLFEHCRGLATQSHPLQAMLCGRVLIACQRFALKSFDFVDSNPTLPRAADLYESLCVMHGVAPSLLAPPPPLPLDAADAKVAKIRRTCVLSEQRLGRQLRLIRAGAPELIVWMLRNVTDREILLQALRLGNAVLTGGNTEAQSVFYDLVRSSRNGHGGDTCPMDDGDESALLSRVDTGFLEGVRNVLQSMTHDVRTSRLVVGKGKKEVRAAQTGPPPEPGDPRGGGAVDFMHLASELLRFLQLLCEGHNTKLQEILREQPGTTRSVNLVAETLSFLDVLCGSSSTVDFWITTANVAPLGQCLDTLAEYCQGPCPGNQRCVLEYSDSCLEILVSLVTHDLHTLAAEDPAAAFGIRRKAIAVLQACLESNTDPALVELVLATVDTGVLLGVLRDMYANFLRMAPEKSEGAGDGKSKSTADGSDFLNVIAIINRASVDPPRSFSAVSPDIVFGVAQALYMFCLALAPHDPKLAAALRSAEAPKPVVSPVTPMSRASSAQYRVADGEIPVPGPDAMAHFAATTATIEIVRDEQLERVSFPIPPICHLLTKASRDLVVRECVSKDHRERLEDFFWVGGLLQGEMEWRASLRDKPIMWMFNRQISLLSDVCFYAAFVMNLIVILFYPLESWTSSCGGAAQASTSDAVRDGDNPVVPSRGEYLDLGPLDLTPIFAMAILKLLGYFQLLASIVVFGEHLHMTHALKQSNELSVALAATDSAVRHAREASEGFSVYSKKRTIYLAVYSLCAFAGLAFTPYFYCLLLFDIIARSDILQNVIRSVTHNWRAFALTSLFTLIVLYAFAILGQVFIPADFVINGEERCRSLLLCTITAINEGLRSGGGIGDVLRPSSVSESVFKWRLVYDVSFFFVVIVIVMNILSGIIIDTFADLRTERDELDSVLRNECFICGIDRSTFDRESTGFAGHIARGGVHNMWSYVYFMVYVRTKEPTEFTGPEQYVHRLISEGNIDWIPQHRALALKQGAVDKRNEDDADAKKSARAQETAVPQAVAQPAAASESAGGAASSKEVDEMRRELKELRALLVDQSEILRELVQSVPSTGRGRPLQEGLSRRATLNDSMGGGLGRRVGWGAVTAILRRTTGLGKSMSSM